VQKTDAELGRLLREVKAAIDGGVDGGLNPYERACIRDAHKVCGMAVCACVHCACTCVCKVCVHPFLPGEHLSLTCLPALPDGAGPRGTSAWASSRSLALALANTRLCPPTLAPAPPGLHPLNCHPQGAGAAAGWAGDRGVRGVGEGARGLRLLHVCAVPAAVVGVGGHACVRAGGHAGVCACMCVRAYLRTCMCVLVCSCMRVCV